MMRIYIRKKCMPGFVVLLLTWIIVLAACNSVPTSVRKTSLPVNSIGIANAVLRQPASDKELASSNSALDGIAQLQLLDHTLTVTVSIIGLIPATTYQTSILDGTCVHEGKVVYQLAPLITGTHGIGSSKTVFKDVSTFPDNRWSVEVQIPPKKATSGGPKTIACGQVFLSH